MSLRTKTAIILFCIVSIYVALSSGIQYGVLLPGFRLLERAEGQEEASRAVSGLSREIAFLDSFCLDWADWNDSYTYVVDGNKAYEQANLADATFMQNRLNLFFVINTAGQVVYGRICELSDESKDPPRYLSMADFPANQWSATSPLLQHESPASKIAGVIRTSQGPMLVSSRPILTTDQMGPIRGTMIMGRFLNSNYVRTLGEQIQLPIRAEMLPESPVPGVVVEPAGSPRAYTYDERLPEVLRVSTIFPDVFGKPLLRLHVTIDRRIMQKGQNVIYFTLWAMAGTGMAVLLLMMAFLERAVLGPLLGFTRHVSRIAKEEDLVLIDAPPRRDEVGTLTVEFNRMVRRIQSDHAERRQAETALREMQERVLRAEHLAALGEMGASVAHEIRNPLAGMSSALQVLRGEFAGDDDRQALMEEVLAQVRRVDMIVNRLLMFAKPWEPVKEPCDLRDLVAGACDEAAKSEPFAGIQFAVEASGPIAASVDPSLLKRVLANLLSNAADALDAAKPANPEIRCSFRQTPTAAVVELRDNAGGIAADALPHLFRPFYTTKTYGTGLGLVICRRIVDAHGGTIAVESTPGSGTVVTLSFPKGR